MVLVMHSMGLDKTLAVAVRTAVLLGTIVCGDFCGGCAPQSGQSAPPSGPRSSQQDSRRQQNVPSGREITLPPGPLPDAPKVNPDAEKIIRRAIQFDRQALANEPLLEDVLRAIRKDGPIWKGTELDPDKANPDPVLGDTVTARQRRQSLAQRRHAAEQLLKAIRILETVKGSQDTPRLKQLMHAEAIRLLTPLPRDSGGHSPNPAAVPPSPDELPDGSPNRFP